MEKDCDVLVIGGGGAGLISGVRAAEVSGGKVIILEKTGRPGGGMLFASTMRVFRSRWQKERNIPDRTDAYLRGAMDLTYWRLDPETVRGAVLGTGWFFDWYEQIETPENMAKYEPRTYVHDDPVTGQIGPQVDGFHKGSGELIVKAMLKRAQELNVELILNAVTSELVSEDGRISYAMTEIGGELVKISCKTCIIASGSWINSRDLVWEVMPDYLNVSLLPNAHQNPNYTGDGLSYSMQAGSYMDRDSMCIRIFGPIGCLGETSKFEGLTHAPELIMVNLNGERFVAEPMVPRMDAFDTGHVLIRQPEGKCFFIYSKNTLQAIVERTSRDEAAAAEAGGAGAVDDAACGGADEAAAGIAAAGTAPEPFSQGRYDSYEELHEWFVAEMKKRPGKFAAADTISDLAARIGIDPDALEKTIGAYDAACEAGEDPAFFKDPAGLMPLGEGPYYAMLGLLSTDGAFGGIPINADMQVYSADERTLIGGLYAAGDITSGRHIVMDGVKKQVINDMSWVMSSGFIAGTNAGKAARQMREDPGTAAGA